MRQHVKGVFVVLLTLILVIPAMAVPVACSVLSAQQNCGSSSGVLSWTATQGASGYMLCVNDAQHCSFIGSGLVLGVSATGTYNLFIRAVDANGAPICDSNTLTMTFPKTCNSVPEFPSLLLPVTLVIGFLGTVLYIRRVREH